MPKKNSSLGYFLFSLVFSILILILGKAGLLNLPQAFLSEISTPVRLLTSSAVAQDQKENLEKEAKSSEQQKIEADMEALRDQFAVIYPRSQNLLPAKVIGMPSFIPGRTMPEYLILNRGESDGVNKGQAVVLSSNLVGKIDRTSENTSRAVLIVNKEMSFTGKTESGAIGVVKGTDEAIEIGNILLSEEINKDMLVLTKGDQDINGLGLPPDLIVGKVVTVDKNPSDLFQKAQIKSFVDFSKLNTVFIKVK